MDPKDMQIQQLTAANGDLTKQIDTYKRLASLNDAQRAHYAKLSEEDRPGFLVKTSDERNAIIKAALDADPAYYTAKSGRVYRTSERELGDMAKRLDDQDAEIAKANGERDNAMFAKTASESFGHIALNKEKGDGVALVKALHTIDNKDGQRDRVMTALKGADAALESGFEPQGADDAEVTETVADDAEGGEGGTDNETPADPAVNPTKGSKVNKARNALQKMADEYAKEHKVHPAIAKRRLLNESTKAKELYQQAQAHDARMRRAN